jgi:hypothetical protein
MTHHYKRYDIPQSAQSEDDALMSNMVLSLVSRAGNEQAKEKENDKGEETTQLAPDLNTCSETDGRAGAVKRNQPQRKVTGELPIGLKNGSANSAVNNSPSNALQAHNLPLTKSMFPPNTTMPESRVDGRIPGTETSTVNVSPKELQVHSQTGHKSNKVHPVSAPAALPPVRVDADARDASDSFTTAV